MYVGKKVTRVDAYDKVIGRTKYTDDLCDKSALIAKIYHSSIANGIVKSIDTSEAEKVPGVAHMAVEGREAKLLCVLNTLDRTARALHLPKAEELAAIVMAQGCGKTGKRRKRQPVGEPGLPTMPRPEERAGGRAASAIGSVAAGSSIPD